MQTNTNTFPAGTYTVFVSATGGTIEYVAPMVMNNRTTYNNLTVSGAGTLTMTNSDLVLNGSLTIGAGVTLSNVNNRNIALARNWTSNGSFSPGTGSVTLAGSVSQNVSGSNTFHNLTINKSGGNVNLTGSGSTVVLGALNLANMNVVSTATNKLSLNSGSSILNGSATSFISGPVSKVMTSGASQAFPLGSISSGYYRQLAINNTTAADTWTVEYVSRNPNLDGYNYMLMNTANIKTVSQFEYWLISRTGSAAAEVMLSYNTGSYVPSDIGVQANLRVARWNGSQWDLPPGNGTHWQTGSVSTGTVSASNVTSFSPFTLASTDAFSPLPVTMLNFSAERENHTIHLKWKTAQERNSDRFDIERSLDGKEFEKIGEIKATGFSSSTISYAFDDDNTFSNQRYYYRLNQVDLDGRHEYSSVIVVLPDFALTKTAWAIYPNPVSQTQSLNIVADDIADAGDIKVLLMTINQQTLFSTSGSLEDVNGRLNVAKSDIKPGIYILIISSSADRSVFRISIL
jgi:hypothetical protein